MKIENDRIALKQIMEFDLGFVCKVESDQSLWQYESSITTEHEQIKRKFIERMNSQTAYDFILQLNNEMKTPIGLMNIWSYIQERSSWEIGYAVLPEFQNQGYCTEALRLLLDFAFNELNAHKVIAMCNEHNTASYKILEKAGMNREGVFRKEYIWNDTWIDQYFYCILEEEYSKSNTK